jgi:arylsulfatase
MAAGAPGGLHPWEVTLAEMLSDAGYRAAMFGKWHLGTAKGRLPTDQGFEEWFGFETTDVSYWTAGAVVELKDHHYIREAQKGEAPRNVQVYDLDTRRVIDRMLTDSSGCGSTTQTGISIPGVRREHRESRLLPPGASGDAEADGRRARADRRKDAHVENRT